MTRRRIVTIARRRFLLVPRPDHTIAVFVRVNGRWSGGAVTPDDQRALGLRP